jgi:chromosome partitioning protein
MSQVIAVVNQKGGVGKTTTCINLSAALASLGQHVLLIDLDPQANASVGSTRNSYTHNSAHILLAEQTIEAALITTEANYNLIPASDELTYAEVYLLNQSAREYRLMQALEAVKDQYDYIFLDCPPSLSLLTINALAAATSVLIPVQCEYLALEGLSSLIETIDKIRNNINANLAIHGLLRTLFDGRNSLSRQVSEQLVLHFKDKVYDTIISRNIRLAEAPSYGKPILLYDPQAVGSQAYLELAQEILLKNGATAFSINPSPLLKQRSRNQIKDDINV